MDRGTDSYRRAYQRGWRYSATSDRGLDYADQRGWTASDGWMDGYLDCAAGRERYHLRDCINHSNAADGCGEA